MRHITGIKSGMGGVWRQRIGALSTGHVERVKLIKVAN